MASRILRTLSVPQDADFATLYQVTLAEWQTMPTIHAGQFDDLKFENARFRVWVSRMTLRDYDGDGAAHAADRLCVEQLVDGAWLRLDRYGRLPA